MINLEKGIIIASFGTTYEITRRLCIESIEKAVEEKYKDIKVFRAFTSEIVRRKLKNRDGLNIYNVPQALEKMKNQGINNVFIQPLHIIPGFEYEKIRNQAKDFKKENKDFKIIIGKPLLFEDSDFHKVIDALKKENVIDGNPIVFMGHGSEHSSDSAYLKLEELFKARGHENIFIGTIEGKKTLEDIIGRLKEKEIKAVKLRPFMLVAGDHAINDMASEDNDSWLNQLRDNSIEVEAEIKGLGQLKAIQNLFLEHIQYNSDTL